MPMDLPKGRGLKAGVRCQVLGVILPALSEVEGSAAKDLLVFLLTPVS